MNSRKIYDIHIRRMRIYMAVCEEGGFSRASIKSGMTQPAVSNAISQIESTLGVRLLERSGNMRQTLPTKDGLFVYEAFSRIVRDYDLLVATLCPSSSGQKSAIVIQKQLGHTMPANWTNKLAALVSQGCAQMLSGSRDFVIDQVKTRAATIGIVDGWVDTRHLDYIEISRAHIGVLAPAEILSFCENECSLDWSSIPDSIILASGFDETVMRNIKLLLSDAYPNVKFRAQIDCLAILASIVSNESQPVLLPSYYVDGFHENNALGFRRLRNPSFTLPIGVIAPRGYLSQNRLHTFFDENDNILADRRPPMPCSEPSSVAVL